jgi:DNA relaxase NicK
MNDAKYIGLDVHQATICAAVLDSAGNLVMEAILEAKTETILQFLGGIRGSLHVTFEEGTWAAWLHDLLTPHVTRVVVCDTRKTGLGKNQNRNDGEDAAAWRGSCTATNWSRCITARTAFVPCGNWHARTWRSRGISPE